MKAVEEESEEGSKPSQSAAHHEQEEEEQSGAHDARRGLILSLRRRPGLIIGLGLICLFYLVAIFADFLAPYDYRAQSRREPLAPATEIHFRDAQNILRARPFIYPRRMVDPLERRYVEDTAARASHLAFFTRGYRYKLFWLFTTDRHLFGVREEEAAEGANAPRLNLLGTDALGRDRLSRLLIASRFSLLVGPLGTLLASALGILLGSVAGYSRRIIDSVLMRAADVMMAMPTLVLILAARAAFPLELPPVRAAQLMISIFVAVGWAEMARLARSQVLSLREREFVLAAESIGLTKRRVLFRHILPNALPPLIVQVTLMLPAFLLTETALSFLGVGLQEPEPSWGNMLTAASDITLLRAQPLLLLAPAFAIFSFVLGVRLLSDGLRREHKSGAL